MADGEFPLADAVTVSNHPGDPLAIKDSGVRLRTE